MIAKVTGGWWRGPAPGDVCINSGKIAPYRERGHYPHGNYPCTVGFTTLKRLGLSFTIFARTFLKVILNLHRVPSPVEVNLERVCEFVTFTY